MEIILTKQAKKDLKFWKKTNNKIIQKRITILIAAIIEDPFQGIGNPEALKYDLSGYWSRRINKEHRLVYKVASDIESITIIAMRFHY